MGRVHPIECQHGVIVGWGDFGPGDRMGEPCPQCVDLRDRTAAKAKLAAEALEVLCRLVGLKDGPRDDAYRSEKPKVWADARAIVESAEGL